MESIRQGKVARLLQKELGEIFRSESKSLFDGAFVTVTVVRASPDLSFAKVYLSIMAHKNPKALVAQITSITPMIRKRLTIITKGQLRVIPELAFFLDDSLDYAENIDKLLKGL